MPNPQELLQRALANEKKLADEQERYECRVTSDGAELDKTGKVKHETIEVKTSSMLTASRSSAPSLTTAKTCRPKKHAKRMSA